MFKLILLFLVSVIPNTDTYYCDTIEHNTLYDANGQVTLDQLIFWRFYEEDNREHVISWKLIPDCRINDPKERAEFESQQLLMNLDTPEKILPYIPKLKQFRMMPTEIQSGFRVLVSDKTGHYKIISHNYKRSHTQYDPELADREFFPKERRPDLPININHIKHNDKDN